MTAQDELGQRGYQYHHGDRPLDGFTIERAAGRGGFGEVYYAHSDSGREVALKVVNTYEQIELRGISQCMNLKDPHLVTIFDVKYGTDGRPWVIMEYVAGPSLRELLDAAPAGLGVAKSAFFLREVGKGLTYLHDCGIVHRDLKPGNIFYENGYVKIGDYGLSKAMSMTRHSGQTVAVGTLHYMAPEIGEGKYDRSIDIYALGALLYEMLTGQVPFLGSSPAEVLLKHLRTEVNLDGIEEPFKSVIRKAMAKNPDERYRSVQEMVEAVFGSEDVRNSVSQFVPASLSMMAGNAARKIGDAGASPVPPTMSPDDPFAKLRDRMHRKGERIRNKWGIKNKLTEAEWHRGDIPLERDRLNFMAHGTMAVGATFLTALIASSFDSRTGGMQDFMLIFWAIVGATAGAVLAWRFIGRGLEQESDWVRRLALGTPVALAAWPFCMALSHTHREATSFSACLALFLLCWNRRLSPWRKERVIVGDAVSAAICAFVVSMIFGASWAPVLAVAVGTSLAVSLFSPWGKPLPRPAAAPAPAAGSPPPFGRPFGPPPFSPFGGPAIPPIPLKPSSILDSSMPGIPKPKIAPSGSPFPAWAIVAIVLGSFAIIFGSGAHIPWFLFPAVIAVVFGMAMALRKSGKNTPPGAPVGSMSGRSSFGQVAASAAHGLISTIGGILLIVSIILALGLVADVPGLLQSKLIPAHIQQQLDHSVGSNWPHLIRELGLILCIAIGWIALLLVLLGRRWGGPMHMIRSILAAATIFGAIAMLRHNLPDWNTISPRDNSPGEIVDAYFQHVDVSTAIKAGVIYLVGWVLLSWPAKRREPTVIYQTVNAGADSSEGKAPQ